MTRSLQELRLEIDALDEQLLKLLNQRAALALEVGAVKQQEGTPVYHPKREAEVINKMQSLPSRLKPQSILYIWREIMSACCALQVPQNGADSQPLGTFAQERREATRNKPYQQLALIGCGLMGGSFALAARQAGLIERVVGYSQSSRTLELAQAMGVIDQAVDSVASAVMQADLVLLSAPVEASQALFEALRPALQPTALLMDVGSTKVRVLEAARAVFGSWPENFVACHPIAGKELAGVAHSDASLYQGKPLIVTPHANNTEARLQQARAVWAALGMRVVQMDAAVHDAVFAAVSHLPHLLSFAYMGGLLQQDEHEQMLALAGTGFQDFSRIAASSAEVWADVFLSNREQLHEQLTHFQAALSRMATAIQNAEPSALRALLAPISAARQAWKTPTQS